MNSEQLKVYACLQQTNNHRVVNWPINPIATRIKVLNRTNFSPGRRFFTRSRAMSVKPYYTVFYLNM